ncbi:MAG: DUF362 domain-containing protein [Methylocystaceae bacterium]
MATFIKTAAIIIVIIGAVFFAVYLWLERSLLPRASTRQFFKLSKMPWRKKAEGYFYAARPDWYLKPVTWNWLLKLVGKRENGDPYHGKVLVKEDAARIITLDKPVSRDLEHILPYPLARQLILDHPQPSIGVMECPCRTLSHNSCPRDVCLVVGEPFVSFILEHSPGKARRLTVDEALQILEEEEQRGHIHTAWFKEVMHNRFYTICNCCSCCCLGMQSHNRGIPRLAHSGYRPIPDADQCASCGTCVNICPFGAISLQSDAPIVNADKCMGCGVCISHCLLGALNLTEVPEKGVPLNVDQLLAAEGWQMAGE